jgi:hypothetical protein
MIKDEYFQCKMYIFVNVHMLAEMVFSTRIIFVANNRYTLKIVHNVTDENIFV